MCLISDAVSELSVRDDVNKVTAVGAASQWWLNERMMVHFMLMMVKYSIMMVKWVYDHIFISPSLTSISPSLTSSSPSLADWTLPPS